MDNFIKISIEFATKNITLIFLLIFIGTAALGKLLPDFIVFTAAGFLANKLFPDMFSQLWSLNFYELYASLILFFIGLQLPWREANLIRRKLYRSFCATYSTLFGVFAGLYLLSLNFQTKLPLFIRDNLLIIPFLFSLLFFLDSFQLKKKISQNKAQGPLTSFGENLSSLFNLVSTLIILGAFTYGHWTIPTLLPGLITIIILALLLEKLNISNLFTNLALGIALFSFLGADFRFTALLPLFCGILLGMIPWNGKKYFLNPETINILNFSGFFLAGKFFTFSSTALTWGFCLFIMQQLVFRITFYLWGRIELNESIYKNLSGFILNPSLFPALLLIGLGSAKLDLLNFSLLFSAALFFKLFSFIIWQFESSRRLIKAGESDPI